MAFVRDLSGILTDCAKWQTTWDALGKEDCDIQHLRVFHTTVDQLKATCSCLVGNKSVKALEIGVAEGEGCKALAQLLAANQYIQTLSIVSLAEPDQNATALAAALQSNSSIQHLTLQKLQPSQVISICQALSEAGCCGKLQQLQLPGARLDPAAAAALQAAVLTQQQLSHLNLRSVVFARQTSDSSSSTTATAGATTSLFSAAVAAHPSLSKIELQQASGIDAAAVGSYLAAAAAAGHTALQTVLLDSISLGDSGMQHLATAAAVDNTLHNDTAQSSSSSLKCSGLTELKLSDNSIGPQGGKALGQMLASPGFRHLSVLNLNQNCLGAEGLAALADGLVAGGNGCLQELHLEANSIKGVEGILALLDSPISRSLTTVNLSHNCIADEPACQLATAVAAAAASSSLALQHLDLSNNWIKDEGAEGLANMLKAHRTLVSLGLAKNRIGCKGIDALILAAFASPGLQQMSLDGNRVRDNRTKLDIEGLSRALASRKAGGSSSRRTSVAGPAAAAAGGSSSSQPSSPRSKQGLAERDGVYGDETADATAAVAAGRAAKVARLGSSSSNTATAAVRESDSAADAMHFALDSLKTPSLRSSSSSSSGPPSPFASRAQSSSGWDEPSLSALSGPAGYVQSAGEQSGQAAGLSADSADGSSSAVQYTETSNGVPSGNVLSAQLASPGGVRSGQFGTFPRVGTLGNVPESMPGPMSDSGMPAGPQLFNLPDGFVRKLRKQSSRSYSFEFWAKNGGNNSSHGNSADGNGSSSGVVLAQWGDGQQQQQQQLGFGDVEAYNQQQGSLAVSALEAASLSLAAFAEPDPLPSLDWQLGMAAGGYDVIDSLSGWVLDEVVSGQALLSSLRNNSMKRIGSSNRLGSFSWPVQQAADVGGSTYPAKGVAGDSTAAALGTTSSTGNSSSKAGSPKAAGAVRRFGSGRTFVRRASLSSTAASVAATAAVAAHASRSRLGQAAAAAATEIQ